MSGEEMAAREKFKRSAILEGRCEEFKVFKIGEYGTVYVGCGMVANHDGPSHQAQSGKPDGDLVVFRWSS